MSNTTLNWELRGVMPHLRDSGRLAVLMCYILHANNRNRSWPSVETLMEESGWARASVINAKAWLVEHGALLPVPLGKRMGEECKLHQRTDVMELTGRLLVAGEDYPILYFNQQTNEPVNSSTTELINSSTTEPEVITNTEDTSNNKHLAEPAEKKLTEWQEQVKAHAEAICAVTGDDLNLPSVKKQAGTVAATLIKAGYSLEDIRERFPAYWKGEDWRGKKGQRPTIHQVGSEIGKIRSPNGHKSSHPDVIEPDEKELEYQRRIIREAKERRGSKL